MHHHPYVMPELARQRSAEVAREARARARVAPLGLTRRRLIMRAR